MKLMRKLMLVIATAIVLAGPTVLLQGCPENNAPPPEEEEMPEAPPAPMVPPQGGVEELEDMD